MLPKPDLLLEGPEDHPSPALRRFAQSVLKANTRNLTQGFLFDRWSFTTLYVMYAVLFLVGVSTAVATIVRSFSVSSVPEAVATFAFAGLSAASFFTLFLIRPLESLERNCIFSSWLVAVMNTYWTRLLYFDNPMTIDDDLKHANDELVANLSALADKHAAAIGKYKPLTAAPVASDSRSKSDGSAKPVKGTSNVAPAAGTAAGGSSHIA